MSHPSEAMFLHTAPTPAPPPPAWGGMGKAWGLDLRIWLILLKSPLAGTFDNTAASYQVRLGFTLMTRAGCYCHSEGSLLVLCWSGRSFGCSTKNVILFGWNNCLHLSSLGHFGNSQNWKQIIGTLRSILHAAKSLKMPYTANHNTINNLVI